jgi:hypothetical protein
MENSQINKVKVSVITPTLRKEGLNVVRNSLAHQSYRNFEHLIGSPFDPEIPEAIWVKDNFKGGFWSLNRIYNRLFSRASGEIIVTWQDWIWAPPDALEKFVINVEAAQAVVSGVGDQYEKVGRFGKPEIKIWSDPRKTDKYGSFYECNPNDAEWNFCAFPREAIFKIGGMDEKLDFLGYGGDQLQAVERMDACGTRFFLDQENESYTVRHSRDLFGGQKNWDKNHVLFNGEYSTRKQEIIGSGQWPILSYLK